MTSLKYVYHSEMTRYGGDWFLISFSLSSGNHFCSLQRDIHYVRPREATFKPSFLVLTAAAGPRLIFCHNEGATSIIKNPHISVQNNYCQQVISCREHKLHSTRIIHKTGVSRDSNGTQIITRLS